MKSVSLLALACTALLAGCFGVRAHTRLAERSDWQRISAELSPRAAVELSCGDQRVELAVLRSESAVPVEVVARGCGRAAVYERDVELGTLVHVSKWRFASVQEEAPALSVLRSPTQACLPLTLIELERPYEALAHASAEHGRVELEQPYQ